MAKVCYTVTSWILQNTVEPVEKWVTQTEQKCKKRPWPLNWLCWLVTTVIKIVTYVTREILVPFTRIVCTTVVFPIGGVVLALSAAWPGSAIYIWTKTWLWPTGRLSDLTKTAGPGPSEFTFSATCNCPDGQSTSIAITLTSDDESEAASLLYDKCTETC